MGEKDITEKTLENYDDVFADIINVLLFQGRQIVEEDALVDALPRSQYKVADSIHEMERDVAKYWKNGQIRIALLGLENQTSVDSDMPLRVIGYDGMAYREQLLKQKSEPEEKTLAQQMRYPVVTLVLYFGYEHHWDKPLNLVDCLQIPEPLKPYVNDYKVHLFEIAYLEDEQVQMFRSDFKMVADYFVQKRKSKDYKPSPETIRHVDEMLKLMSVLTKDLRFEQVYQKLKGKVSNMCEVLDRIEERGRKEGHKEGRKEGHNDAVRFMSEAGMSNEEIGKIMKMPISVVIEILRR